MDRIKKLKIKKQDGTFSDYVPIGADAENIDTTDGESVQLKLNKKPYYYNSVADMKADNKLKIGDMAITLGYYEANDGGAAKYKVTDNQNQNQYQENLENNLYAEMIMKNNINVEQFGAHGDNTTDDTLFIQNAINAAIKLNKKLIARGKYLINSSLTISGNYLSIDFTDSEINYNGNESAIIITKCATSNLHFGKINALNNGANCLELKCESSQNYIQYLNIYFQNLKANDKCIFINKTGGWINEIRFFNGQVTEGNYGIYTTSGPNNITFQNIGIEGVNTGFYLDNIYSWNFINCRYHESYETIIETIGTTQRCNFIGSGLFYLNKCKFSNETHSFKIIAPIAEVGGSVLDCSCVIHKGLPILNKKFTYLNLSNVSDFNTRNQYQGKVVYNYFLVSANTHSIILDDRYGYENGINEFYVKCNFDNNTEFSIYKNERLIFNNTSNAGWKYLHFIWNGYEWFYEPVTLNTNLIVS